MILTSSATFGVLALLSAAAFSQNSAGTSPSGPGGLGAPGGGSKTLNAPTIDAGVDGCALIGFVGDTTLAGGWTAFETAAGVPMEVLACGCSELESIASLPSSLGPVAVAPDVQSRLIGSSWVSWSHGYGGEVFWTLGRRSIVITMPPGTTAFDFYSEPNPFAVHAYTATGTCTGGGSTVASFSADGAGGANHCGFYGAQIATIRIECSADFAIGEWRISGEGGTGLGEKYCAVNPNSTGSEAHISAEGSASIAVNDFTLIAEPVPDQSYIFFHGPGQLEIPFGNGFLCISSPQVRLLPPATATGNRAQRTLDLVGGGFVPGTRNFQCWFRDPAAGGAFFNTSNGFSVTFTP